MYNAAIEALRKIETERELTESEERRLIGLLRCRADDGVEIEGDPEFTGEDAGLEENRCL